MKCKEQCIADTKGKLMNYELVEKKLYDLQEQMECIDNDKHNEIAKIKREHNSNVESLRR